MISDPRSIGTRRVCVVARRSGHDGWRDRHSHDKPVVGGQDSVHGACNYGRHVQASPELTRSAGSSGLTALRGKVPEHARRDQDDLSDRGFSGVLQGAVAELDGRQPCRCAVPSVRKGKVMGR